MVCIIIVGHMPILPYFVSLLLIGLLSPSPFYFPLFSGVAVSRTRIAMKFRILACLCVTWICPGDILVHFRQCASWTLFPGDGRRLLLTPVRPYTPLPQHTGENAVVAATPTMEASWIHQWDLEIASLTGWGAAAHGLKKKGCATYIKYLELVSVYHHFARGYCPQLVWEGVNRGNLLLHMVQVA